MEEMYSIVDLAMQVWKFVSTFGHSWAWSLQSES